MEDLYLGNNTLKGGVFVAKKIAVEDNLSAIKQALEKGGYTVVSPKSKENVMACVVMGMDNNLMDIQNTVTKAPVIDAAGMTPEQVISRIESLQ
jgi:hypothetical protein